MSNLKQAALRVILAAFLVALYAAFSHSPTGGVDDAHYIVMADRLGAWSILVKDEDSYYPLSRVAALAGEYGLAALAVVPAVWLVMLSVRIFGWVHGSLLSAAIFFVLGNARSAFASSLGLSTHIHFVFLCGMLLLVNQTKHTRSDLVVSGAASLFTGLPGLLFPVFLLNRRHWAMSGVLVATLATHVLVKQFLPSDTTLIDGQVKSLLTRQPSFEPVIFVSVFLNQGLVSLLPDVKVFTGTTVALYQHGFLLPYALCGIPWLVVSFLGGFRFGLAALWMALCCFVFSVPNLKWHMLPYPDHGHYLHWVACPMLTALAFYTQRKSREDK